MSGLYDVDTAAHAASDVFRQPEPSRGGALIDQWSVHPPSETIKTVEFTGDNGDFRRMVTKGAALELITFGFYRFWLATAMRRHLWQSTKFQGDALEYTGNAKELLIGFLFALAILAPIYLGYFLLGLEAERYKAFASLPLALFFFVFGQFALYRARRFRLTRTLWRGVRFWMSGSGWKYAVLALLWDALTVVSLGLALPWRNAALERYKMNHTRYGSLQGSFVGQGSAFFKSAWALWLFAVILASGFAWPLGLVIVQGQDRAQIFMNIHGGGLWAITGLFATLFVPFLYGAFKAKEWKWWLEGVRFGEVSATSSLGASAYYSNTWKFIGLSIPIFVIYASIVFAIMNALVSHPAWRDALLTQVSSAGQTTFQAGIVVNVVIYLLFMLMFGIVLRIYLQQRIWKMVISSLDLHNTQALNTVTAQGDSVNALGEGFADGLDIVGF